MDGPIAHILARDPELRTRRLTLDGIRSRGQFALSTGQGPVNRPVLSLNRSRSFKTSSLLLTIAAITLAIMVPLGIEVPGRYAVRRY